MFARSDLDRSCLVEDAHIQKRKQHIQSSSFFLHVQDLSAVCAAIAAASIGGDSLLSQGFSGGMLLIEACAELP